MTQYTVITTPHAESIAEIEEAFGKPRVTAWFQGRHELMYDRDLADDVYDSDIHDVSAYGFVATGPFRVNTVHEGRTLDTIEEVQAMLEGETEEFQVVDLDDQACMIWHTPTRPAL